MASQVAPGYNPEVSLLQGGTAPILPVQGGGSMEAGSAALAGYNPAQSVLANAASSSTTPIVAIRGGGQTGGEGEQKSYSQFTLELYDPPLEMIELPKLPEQTERRTLANWYGTASFDSLREVQSLDRAPVTYARRDDTAPTFQKCTTEGGKRKLPLNFFEIVRKRIVVVDEPNPFIWLIPNLRGNLSQFLQYMKLIPKTPEGLIQRNHFVVFTGSFFSINPDKTIENQNLYHQFLVQKTNNMNEKANNMNNIFYLNNLNDDFVTISCDMIKSMYSLETLLKPESQQKPLTTFYEPDILLFTNPKLILKNSELPVQRDDNNVKLSTLLKRPDFIKTYKSFVIVPSRDIFDDLPGDDDASTPADKRYFSFAFNRSVIKQIKFPAKSEIICPKGSLCKGFQGGYKIVGLGDDRKLDRQGLYVLYSNTDKMPFLKEAGSKLSPEELASLTTTAIPPPPVKKEEPLKPLEPSANLREPIKKKSLLLPPITPIEKEIEEPFKVYDKAVKAETRKIEVNLQSFLIRIPYEKGVREDWQKGYFTDDEANLLNSLQLTPTLLSDTFGSKIWSIRLAEFLESLIESNCFENTSLLTKLECSNSQEFIKQIYYELYNRRLSELYDSSGMPKPDTLDSTLAKLKKIGAMGPSSSLLSISKYEYTGDLLDRFQVIKFNSKTGQYYTDIADISAETQKVLERLKLYRVKSMNFEEISKAILARLGVPPPSGGPPPPPSGGPPPTPVLLNVNRVLATRTLPEDFFDTISVSGDGLCFYRAVIKALDPKSQSDSAGYDPDKAKTLAFITQIKNRLKDKKTQLIIRNSTGTPVFSGDLETYFNTLFARKGKEATAVTTHSPDRIRIGNEYWKMTFQEFLNAMDMDNDTNRPWAEVKDAGIGQESAKMLNKMILIYIKKDKQYELQDMFYESKDFIDKDLPISSFIFLEQTGYNHFQLLRIKPGKTWPGVTTGGGDEDVLDLGDPLETTGGGEEEILDLGEPMKNKTRRNRKQSKHTSRRHAARSHRTSR